MVKRGAIQTFFTIATNSYLAGFVRARVYKGPLKNICLPGLNCYSCPGSLGSCPIGALQSVLGSREFGFSFYLAGFFLIVGAFMGRVVCGFLCPFGLFQDLLNKIPFPRKIRTFMFDKQLRFAKYVVLAVFIVLLPLVAVDATGLGAPWFCKYICPSGTLMAGTPLAIASSVVRESLGFLFVWKYLLLAVTVLLSIMIYRPFCKYVCPLGAIYALFNKCAVIRLKCDTSRCTRCGKCASVCGMGVNPALNGNSGECIRCGDCARCCPEGCIRIINNAECRMQNYNVKHNNVEL